MARATVTLESQCPNVSECTKRWWNLLGRTENANTDAVRREPKDCGRRNSGNVVKNRSVVVIIGIKFSALGPLIGT